MYWNNGKLIPQEFLENPDPTLVPMVYEVFRVLQHKPLFLAEHLDRMFHSIELLGFDKPYSPDQMKKHLFELLDTEPERIGNIKIRLSWWPEPILEIGYIPHIYPTLQEQSEGVEVSTFHAIRNTPNIKLWNAALRARTNQALQDLGVFEVLLVNEAGNITEGSRTNHFYVKDSVLCTAPLESVLPGITRQKVIDAADVLNIKLIENYLHESEVGQVDEMFTSGTSAGVQPIAVVNGIRLPEDKPVTLRLQQVYNQMVELEIGPNNYGW
ncbi:MAG: aminotransferase class IV [Bacteroidia bacterium]|nr:aminotransferase class IV [Bacteroidia bacterium]